MAKSTKLYSVETEGNTVAHGWSYIVGPNGYREGPYRYRWEAEEFAEQLEIGTLQPETQRGRA